MSGSPRHPMVECVCVACGKKFLGHRSIPSELCQRDRARKRNRDRRTNRRLDRYTVAPSKRLDLAPAVEPTTFPPVYLERMLELWGRD